ncbi:MAG: hypothetical protein CL389_13105 [Acidiferrobacteraceae bacterium]|jgi:TolB-like protein|nr:hypothetical protein [Acidiferrobacteraceae bacterium]|tara:strand:- start:5169 stop:7139 length:1971 start_codon:yes stop_codon:yes gene_type:complete
MERPFPAYQGDEPYIFVSYAHDDAALVYPEITRLRSEGFNIWYDEGISPGSTWRDEVALALTQCRLFLYFISPRSVVSANCLKEVNFCLSRERKVLSVHLEKTELPMGLELSLSDMQAIIRADHTTPSYERKLSDSLKSLLPNIIEPIATPFDKPIEADSDEKSIAILPLVNRNLDAENDYLCDGISEELINGLVQIEGLRVSSRLSAFAFKNQDLDVREMGEKLGVANILSGSVQKSGNRVRISVQLNWVKDGSTLWSHRYDQTLDDIFELQDDVARKVIDALKIELGSKDTDKVIDVGTVNIEAYDAYLAGIYATRSRTHRGFERAIGFFKRAITIDKGFLRAYWPLCDCYIQLARLFGAPREEMLAAARDAIEPARTLDSERSRLPWFDIDRDLDSGLETEWDLRRLARQGGEMLLNPSHPGNATDPLRGYSELALVLMRSDLHQSAILFSQRYLQQSDSFTVKHMMGLSVCALGRYDKAIDIFTKTLDQVPEYIPTRSNRAALYCRTGQYSKAEIDLAIIASSVRMSWAQLMLMFWHDDLDSAREYFDEMQRRKNLSVDYRAIGRCLFGNIEEGIQYFEQAFQERQEEMKWIRPILRLYLPQSTIDELERHPRYQALWKEMGIDDQWREELVLMTNELTDVTGIHVQLDEVH